MLAKESGDFGQLLIIQRKGVTLIFHNEKRGRHMFLPKDSMQGNSVVHRYEPIAVSVIDQERRRVPRDQVARTRLVGEVEPLFDVTAKHLGDYAKPPKTLISTTQTDHVCRGIKDTRGVYGRLVLRQCDQSGEMPTRGFAANAHALWVDSVPGAVRLDPINRRERILDLSRPAISPA